ncbi:HpcH/HpaI aldolase/citrate lyase family protein [Neoaquamicrobium sediminum]|uniref:Aldolase/citrate lyase family protein n=1 Tax=Neoaquamicrobium sediminum TaxID=1849104 RepID=A0ABV3WWA5_9HYPH
MWPLRTMLFIPAHKRDWAERVDRFAPDSVVIDLEDALPLELKVEGRAMARDMIGLMKEKGIPAFVRINAMSETGAEDVSAIVCDGLAGIMPPKSRTVEEIRALDRLLGYEEGRAGLPHGQVAIMPLPETAEGLWAARDLAAASNRCRGIIGVTGGPISGDVARAVGFSPSLEGTEQLYLASKMVLDSRAGGAVYPMASIIGTKLDDHAAVEMLVKRAKSLGFTGAVLIHPSHVAIAQKVFRPTEDEIRYFAGMIAAMEDAFARGDAAVSYRGSMVDYAMLPLAREVVEEGRRNGVTTQ